MKSSLFQFIFCSLAALTLAASPARAVKDIEGEILSIAPEDLSLTLRHEPIPGFIDSTETVFSIGKGDAAICKAGDKIRARLRDYAGGYRLEFIWRVNPISGKIARDVNRQLRQDTVIRGSGAYRSIGEYIPSFALYNQESDLVTSQTLRGKPFVINFIFTRCAMPMMCPAATDRMSKLQQKAKEAGIEDFRLVSVSFDPDYDSPGILWEYAHDRGIDTGNFSFLTGEERAIRDVLKQFGVIAMQEDGTIKHTMSTILVDANGKIAFRKEGMHWNEDDFLKRLQQ